MSIIYHIAKKAQWQGAEVSGNYVADSLKREGFIHCSTREQVVATANRLFAGQHDLILLAVDDQRIAAPVRYENMEGGSTLYPHVYGLIPVSAVMVAYVFCPDAKGVFEFPGVS